MILTYAGKSAISARMIESESYDVSAMRRYRGDVNWGRAVADTQLNPDISNVTNKRVMRELFSSHNVPMPRLFPTDQAAEQIDNGLTIVGRPDHHMKGRGFWKCQTIHDLNKALRGTRRKKPATHFMEFIAAPREYRVHIFRGKSIRISEKDHTAFHEYTTVKPTARVWHVRKAAKQAVEAVWLDFGAVDILANDRECWVLEVNAAPGLGGTMPKLYAEVFEEWYESTR